MRKQLAKVAAINPCRAGRTLDEKVRVTDDRRAADEFA
jgi:hypothetical protein